MNPVAVRRNQFVFREVNNRIAEVTASRHEGGAEFLCECGSEECHHVIALDLREYEGVRADEGLFLLASGHAVEGVDELVEARAGYDLAALSKIR